MSFVWPRSQCLGRQPCGLQADGHQAPCLTGCRNQPRWKDGLNERAIDRQELRRSFGNYIINDPSPPTATAHQPSVMLGTGSQLMNKTTACGS